MNKIIICTQCGKNLKGKQTMYCSTKCKNRNHQSYDSQKLRGLQRKIHLISEFGSKCEICGYESNLAALTFHHKIPEEKNFKLDMRSLSNRRMDQIKTEIKKCILVCHNCHAEIHHPQHNLAESPSSRLL